MAPISRKRSTPPHNDGDPVEESTSKRRRVESVLPQTPPPEELLSTHAATISLFDHEPRQLLSRSVALALERVGFESASPEALESLCCEADTYVQHLLSRVTESMLHSRRSQPTPIDFAYALARFDLPIASLEPHIKPPISVSKIHPQFGPSPAEESTAKSLALLLGDELSGEPDKLSKAYIPKRFPSFPSKHTYKWTEKESARETDPRKIREEAAKSARQGEEALRRLVKVSKAGKEKDVKRAANRDPKSKERHEMWEKTMKEIMAGKRNTAFGKVGEDEDQSMIVNSDRQYWRKGVPAKRKPPAPLDIRMED